MLIPETHRPGRLRQPAAWHREPGRGADGRRDQDRRRAGGGTADRRGRTADRPEPAGRDLAAQPAEPAERGERRPGRPVPDPRADQPADRGGRDREHDAGRRARAHRGDRPAPCRRRPAPAHRRAVPRRVGDARHARRADRHLHRRRHRGDLRRGQELDRRAEPGLHPARAADRQRRRAAGGRLPGAARGHGPARWPPCGHASNTAMERNDDAHYRAGLACWPARPAAARSWPPARPRPRDRTRR